MERTKFQNFNLKKTGFLFIESVLKYLHISIKSISIQIFKCCSQEKEEKAKFKLESKEKLKDDKKEKVKDKDKEKVKEKDKDKVKEKEKEKVKEKDKDKKDKKLTKVPSTVTSGVPFEEIFTLGGE